MAAVGASWAGQQRTVGGSVSVVLPAVYEQLSSERVLVIEWLDGVNLRAAGQLIEDRGLDRAELTGALLRSMVYQITEGGVFHADPHPGNVLLLTDGRLALLDFGSVGRLDTQQRSALQDLLLALGRGDPAALATPCWNGHPSLTRSTNSSLSEPWASSWRATSRAVCTRRLRRCLPTCSAWLPALSWPSSPRNTSPPSCAPWPPWKARSPC